MSWDSEIPLLIRNYVGDTDTTNQKYNDDSVIALLLSAAQFVIVDVPLVNTYLLSIENASMSPDPTSRQTTTSRDDPFINLIILKAAWMISNAELRNYGAQAIGIKDGSSSVDLKRDLRSLRDIVKMYEDAYFEYKNRYIREANNTGQIITTPIKLYSNGFGPAGGGWVPRLNRW